MVYCYGFTFDLDDPPNSLSNVSPSLLIDQVERQPLYLHPNWNFFNAQQKAIIPFSHRRNSRIWFLKLHGPLFITHFNWLSIANLNWNSPSPTSVIVISFPIFHTDLRRFFVALKFIFLVVWNLPTRLSEQSSNKVYEQNPYFLIIT